MLEALGEWFVSGGSVAWKELFPGCEHVSLPTYPWQRKRYWIDSPAQAPARGGAPAELEALLQRLSASGKLSSAARASLPDILAALEAERETPNGAPPAAPAGTASLRATLDALPPEQLEEHLVRILSEEVAQSLPAHDRQPLALDVPLSALGLDSLTAVQLRSTLQRKLALPSSLRLGLDAAVTSVKSLAAQLVPLIASGPALDTETVDLRSAAALEPSIGPRPGQLSAVPNSVLLTGATGFLGAFLLSELLQRTSASVTCLVRAQTEADAMNRLERNLTSYGLPTEALRRRVRAPRTNRAAPIRLRRDATRPSRPRPGRPAPSPSARHRCTGRRSCRR